MAQCCLDSDEGLLADGQSAYESPQHTIQQEAGESQELVSLPWQLARDWINNCS